MLDNYENCMNLFTRDKYKQSFADFYLSRVAVMDAIEQLYLNVKEPDAMLDNMASALAKSAVDILEKCPKRKYQTVSMNLSLTMAGYVLPALLHYKGQSSKALVDKILQAWKKEFPKSNLSAADYESIEGGFHRKWCYITTAACTCLGMSDDCYELNLLREYRDTYLASLENGQELIDRYYDLAPTIVKHISRQKNPKAIYQGIWDAYILPCIRLIEEGRPDDCEKLYESMVEDLKERFFYLYPDRGQTPQCSVYGCAS